MCFTNSLSIRPKALKAVYHLAEEEDIAFDPMAKASGFDHPQWPILTTRKSGNFELARWGLVPDWATSESQVLKIRQSTLNARGETLDEKPSFKHAFLAGQRCVIPSTGFYEWQTVGKKKYPYFITLSRQRVLSLAGLWEERTDLQGHSELTFTIITVPANPLMGKIHNSKKRMPAILVGDAVTRWLYSQTSTEEASSLLTPIDESLMKAHTIAPLQSRSALPDFEEITRPYEYPELTRQLGLF